jgi:hypothetical protein
VRAEARTPCLAVLADLLLADLEDGVNREPEEPVARVTGEHEKSTCGLMPNMSVALIIVPPPKPMMKSLPVVFVNSSSQCTTPKVTCPKIGTGAWGRTLKRAPPTNVVSVSSAEKRVQPKSTTASMLSLPAL